jgi:asparagine synthase (glutamine-hydrolysing)
MCGIGGIINSGLGRDALEQRLLAMQRSLRHRGPDDEGLFIASDGATGLVNTRLSILDLSAAGHQPMASADGRYHVVFNGEIYNFEALRAEMERDGDVFQSHSDTEVILKMYERFGPDCVREFEGMFAIAIWDEREQTCFLARGPLGIKPLYYWEKRGTLVFASEMRPLLSSGLIPRKLSSQAVAGYLLFGAAQEPDTLIDQVCSLPAGFYLLWRNGKMNLKGFWTAQFEVEPFNETDAVTTVRAALEDSVRRHLVSDVPVSLFLSGGIDSTALLALAKQRGANLRTFCISLDDPRFNEGNVARRTAEHFGVEHFDWRLDSGTARRLLEQFLERSDQPSIDGFNTFCVSKHAHDHGAKVVLSGLGGDEVFGGYPSFATVPRLVAASRAFNAAGMLRQAAGRVLALHSFSPRVRRLGNFLAGPPTSAAAYWCMRGIFTPRETSALLQRYCAGVDESDEVAFHFPVPVQPTVQDEVSYLEVTRYMRNQLLRDSDVMSMAWSLELRVPFVDRKLVDTIGRIPAAMRLAKGKQILLKAVPEIPEWVARRSKHGFVFPFKDWVTREWRDIFVRIELESPVKLQTWYRCWCIFALNDFIERNGIDADRLAAAA